MTPCLEHNQGGDKFGYAYTTVNGKTASMHRKIYAECNNIPYESLVGKIVRHTCDNPRCIEPLHLTLGTQKDNVADCISRGRRYVAKGSEHGMAILSEEIVSHIREVYVPRHKLYGCRALARKYGVSARAVSAVINHKTWK